MAIDLVASGAVPVEDLVTHRFALAEAQQASDVALDKSTGSLKVLIGDTN